MASACIREGCVHTCVQLLALPVCGGVCVHVDMLADREICINHLVYTHTVGENLWLYVSAWVVRNNVNMSSYM